MRREFIATVGSEQRSLIVENGENGSFHVSIDGHPLEVDAAAVGGGTWSLIIGGRSYLIDLEERHSGTVVLTHTSETSLLVEDALRKRLADAVAGRNPGAGTGEVIAAPIAGRVVKLLVAPGDAVSAGQAVAVLEAMKMENEINAERGGEVETVHVAAGDAVDTRDTLVTLV
jgi:biotin carboxyl carrier protein